MPKHEVHFGVRHNHSKVCKHSTTLVYAVGFGVPQHVINSNEELQAQHENIAGLAWQARQGDENAVVCDSISLTTGSENNAAASASEE